MDYAEINGAALRYELSGQGAATLVLIHEMGGTLESWDDVAPRLGHRRRVLRYDTRGAGMSEKLRATPGLDGMSDDVAGLLDALSITGPVALAGVAVGAAIGIDFALRYPSRTAALVAMGPATGVSGDRRTATLERAELVERGGMRAIVEGSMAAAYPAELRGDTARFERFRARWLGGDPASFAAINRMLTEYDLTPRVGGIECPALVMAGLHDRLRPPDLVEPLAAAIPGARFRVLDTGHFMAWQTPELVAAAIDGFLDGLGL
jgi:3-oxoadipate enol-lactonase